MSRRLVAAAGVACTAVALAGRPAAAVPPTLIQVEIDYMVDTDHSHLPSQAELDAIVQMFACHGITLVAEISDAVPHEDVLIDGPAANDFFTATGLNTFTSIKSVYQDHTGGGWHYCLFGHTYTDNGSTLQSSGIAENGGDDLLVSLGTFANEIGTPFDRAATFAHELGHNLGLTHEGGQPAVVGKYKPVYASIMSYAFQLSGIRSQLRCWEIVDNYALFKEIDYSDGRMPVINEAALSETLGARIRRVDWNCDGLYQGTVAQDTDDVSNDGKWCDENGSLDAIADSNDWALIQDNTFAAMPEWLPTESCITSDEAMRPDLRGPGDCPPPQPALVTESCTGAVMAWVQAGYGGPQAGTGSQPYGNFATAYGSVPAQSVLYVQPGIYTAGNGILSKPLIIAGPGGAEIRP